MTWRVGLAALVLAVPAAMQLRGRWNLLRRGWPSIVLFGLIAVATCQLAYFFAIERLSVAVALLIEYSGIVLVVMWLWWRRGQRPRPLTVLGVVVAIAGLALMLDIFGAIEVDLIGVLWALLAAVGLAAYFVISADQAHGLPGMVVAAGGLAVGATALLAAGATGLVATRWNMGDVTMAGTQLPWWAALAALALFSTALAYVVGILAARRLGAKIASLLGLSEVSFAVVWAWLLLSELPAAIQLLGGALMVVGVAVVRLDERSTAR